MKKKLWIAAVVLLADRVTKLLWSSLPAEGVTLIPGIIGLTSARNTGMAFSLFSGRPWLLGVLSVVIILCAALYLRGKELSPLCQTGLMMMLGGGLGNMADRFITGYVPDMIELRFVRFAIFNVADACLVIGCLLVMIALFRSGK